MRRHLANRALAAEVCQVLITIVATSLQMRVVGVYAQQLVAPGTLKRGPRRTVSCGVGHTDPCRIAEQTIGGVHERRQWRQWAAADVCTV
jgi:hypothetical protein